MGRWKCHTECPPPRAGVAAALPDMQANFKETLAMPVDQRQAANY